MDEAVAMMALTPWQAAWIEAGSHRSPCTTLAPKPDSSTLAWSDVALTMARVGFPLAVSRRQICRPTSPVAPTTRIMVFLLFPVQTKVLGCHCHPSPSRTTCPRLGKGMKCWPSHYVLARPPRVRLDEANRQQVQSHWHLKLKTVQPRQLFSHVSLRSSLNGHLLSLDFCCS